MFSPIAYIVPEKEASELFFHSGCSPRNDAAGLSEEQVFDIKKGHDASRGCVSLSVCPETGHRVNKKIMAKLAGRRFF